MAKKDLKQYISRYINTTTIIINLVFGLILGLVIRNITIEKAEKNLSKKIDYSITQIQNQLVLDLADVTNLSEIVKSQINTPKAFYDFNSLFTHILSAKNSINNIFIILSPNEVKLEESLYPLLDSLNRYNLIWKKNANNIVYIDSLLERKNDFYYNTVKNKGELTIFASGYNQNLVKSKFEKTIALPIYEGTHFIGVIGFSINFNNIGQILTVNDLEKSTFICDENKKLFYERGHISNISKHVTEITNELFADKQNDIIRNNDFIAKNQNAILFYKSFKPTPFNVLWNIGVYTDKSSIYQKANLYFLTIILLSLLFSAIIIITVKNILKRQTKAFVQFSQDVEKLSQGDTENKITSITNYKEITNISENIETLRQRLIEIQKIHTQIQEQNITSTLASVNENDHLAKSINQTIEKINGREQKRKETILQKEKNDWINTGLNILHEKTRITSNSLEELTDKMNEVIVSYTEAFISSFFITETGQYSSTEYLKAISTFGIDQKKAHEKVINLGEGVVGSVAKEKKRQYLEKIEKNYHIVIAGLSEMQPKSMLVQPLIYENKLYGVLEIAFLKNLQQYELNFFERAATEIALSIKNILGNISTNKLLSQMQTQEKELESLQEDLKNKDAEIENIKSKLNESEFETENMIKAINKSLLTVECSPAGIMLNANIKFLHSLDYTLKEIKGKNLLDLLELKRYELEEITEKVLKGEFVKKTLKYRTKYGETKLLATTYSPYFEINNNISKIIIFAYDITGNAKQVSKMEKKIRILEKQVKILRKKL